MAVSVSRREIEKEADDNIALGRLLRIEREDHKARAVEHIVAADLRISQKIEKIRQIDDQQGAEEVEEIVRRTHLQALRRQTARIRSLIKTSPSTTGYLQFLLKQRRRIGEFARKTHVLEVGFFPPGIRINSELRTFFVQSLQGWAGELSPRLKPVLEHGWLYLTPLQFNLIVLLKALVDKLLVFDFVHLNYRDRNLIDRLKGIESLFLMLHYRPEYLEILSNSLQTVYEKQGKDEDDGQETLALMKRILAEEFTLPSLYNCIVGLNIAKCRHFFTLASFMRSGLGEVVNSTEFNCTAEVRKRIDEYVNKSVESIKKVHGQLHEVRRLNSYLHYDEQGGVDTANLRLLYEEKNKEEERNFEANQGNVLLFAQHLFDSFVRAYLPLLNGKVQIRGAGRVAVFSRSFYEIEMAKLTSVVEKLKRGPFHFSNFPLSQYLQVKEAKIGAIGNEAELIQIIDDGIAGLADLGKSLARVLGGSQGTVEGEDVEPLESVVLRGKPYSIPYGDRRIEQDGYLKNKTVSQALADAVSLCFTMGMLFRDRFVFFVLSREKRYETEIESQMKLLKNLLQPEGYQELLSLYG